MFYITVLFDQSSFLAATVIKNACLVLSCPCTGLKLRRLTQVENCNTGLMTQGGIMTGGRLVAFSPSQTFEALCTRFTACSE